MRSFTDTEGRTWKVVLSTISIKRVLDSTGVLLTKIGDDDLALLNRLYTDNALTVDIVWELVKRQAKALGVVDDEETQATEYFAEGLGGDALENATEALVGAIHDFFPNQAVREALAKVMETVGKAKAILNDKIREGTAKIDSDLLAKTSTDSVLSGLQSPESTPGDTHLEN